MAGGWETQAACRGLDPRLFEPGPVSNASIAQAERARAVCASCPVQRLCLDDALAAEKGQSAADRDESIRAGFTGRERYALQVGHRLPRRPQPIPDDGRDHGERRTYRKGCRCYACRAAETNKEPRPPRVLMPCGTKAAYRRHLRNGEDIDPECAATQRGRYSSPRPVPEVRPACGTRSGYQWHTQHHEIPCPECTAADQAVSWFARESVAA